MTLHITLDHPTSDGEWYCTESIHDYFTLRTTYVSEVPEGFGGTHLTDISLENHNTRKHQETNRAAAIPSLTLSSCNTHLSVLYPRRYILLFYRSLQAGRSHSAGASNAHNTTLVV